MSSNSAPDLSIVMPVYNEEQTVVEAVRRALNTDIPGTSVEIVVVDDGSQDGSLARLKEEIWPPDVKILELGANHGKGHAVRVGAACARGAYLAVLDADLEYDPQDLQDMFSRVMEANIDAVIGTRLWQAHSAYGYWYVVGNRLINTVCNALYNAYLSDFGACLKVIPTDLFRSLDLREPGFGFDAELVARLLRRRARIFEVPVHYMARRREEGKKITVLDGVKILAVFLRCRIR